MAGLKPAKTGGDDMFVNFTQAVDKDTSDGNKT